LLWSSKAQRANRRFGIRDAKEPIRSVGRYTENVSEIGVDNGFIRRCEGQRQRGHCNKKSEGEGNPKDGPHDTWQRSQRIICLTKQEQKSWLHSRQTSSAAAAAAADEKLTQEGDAATDFTSGTRA